MDEQALLAEQIRYYRARAPEYDDWFLRRGAFDRGAVENAAWFDEVETVASALARMQPSGPALELACGTGWWTQRLATRAERVTAVDASPEVIERNRARVEASHVRYVQADLFTWRSPERYDFVFFGFWLSHVPARHFEAFWSAVRAALRPGGVAFFVDNRSDRRVRARRDGSERIRRELSDGRRFDLVKVIYEPEALEARLAALGFEAEVEATPHHFVYGHARPTPMAPDAG